MAIEGRGRDAGFVLGPGTFGSVDPFVVAFCGGAVVIGGTELTCTRGNAIDGSLDARDRFC